MGRKISPAKAAGFAEEVRALIADGGGSATLSGLSGSYVQRRELVESAPEIQAVVEIATHIGYEVIWGFVPLDPTSLRIRLSHRGAAELVRRARRGDAQAREASGIGLVLVEKLMRDMAGRVFEGFTPELRRGYLCAVADIAVYVREALFEHDEDGRLLPSTRAIEISPSAVADTLRGDVRWR